MFYYQFALGHLYTLCSLDTNKFTVYNKDKACSWSVKHCKYPFETSNGDFSHFSLTIVLRFLLDITISQWENIMEGKQF